MSERPQRNLAMELVRVTEATALAAAGHMGLGDRHAADQAAVDAMRAVLSTIDMAGVIVIGEGEKDQAPMLYNGEIIGNGRPPAVDVAVDPVEGTRLLALGRPNALSVIALAERWGMWDPGPSLYMEKLVVGRAARSAIDLRLGPTENLQRIATARSCRVSDLTVFVLDKPRHEALIAEIRSASARVSLHTDGDVAGAILAAMPRSGVDVMMGIGGTPEGVIAAAAVRALGGAMQGRRAPQGEAERQRVLASCPAPEEIVTQDDLVRGEDVFFAATGITDGSLLGGVQYDPDEVTTHSLVLRAKTGTRRYIRAIHRLDDLMRFSQINYLHALRAEPGAPGHGGASAEEGYEWSSVG
jgi:fructose-1,6-bisphosphatase II